MKKKILNICLATVLAFSAFMTYPKVNVYAEMKTSTTRKAGAVITIGSTEYSSIQTAVDNAKDGDTISIGEGTYNESVTVNKDLALTFSGKGTSNTIIRGDTGAVFSLETSKNVRFENLTIHANSLTDGKGIVVDSDTKFPNIYLDSVDIKAASRGINYFVESKTNASNKIIISLKDSNIYNTKVENYDTQTAIGDYRGIGLFDVANAEVTLDGSSINGFGYAINISGTKNEDYIVPLDDLVVNVNNSIIKSWTAMNIWGAYSTYNVTNSLLKGINTSTGSSDSFSTIVVNEQTNGLHCAKGNTFNMKGTTITNYVSEEAENVGTREQLFRIDNDGVANVNLDKVAFVDTTGNLEAAFYSTKMNEGDFTKYLKERLTRSKVTSKTIDGKELPLMYGVLAEVQADAITLSQSSLNLLMKEKKTLTTTITPEKVDNNTVTWTSSDKSIATVDTKGTVTAIKKGNAVITATTSNGKYANCAVTVQEPTNEIPEIDETNPSDKVEVGLNDKNASSIINNSLEEILEGKGSYVDSTTIANLKDAIDAGKSISTEVYVNHSEESEIDKTELKDIQNIMNELSSKNNSITAVAQYFDLGIVLKADGSPLGEFNELNKPIEFTMVLPKEIIKDGRTFSIVRVHAGKAEKLNSNVTNNVINFTTDKFSTYALVYEDKKEVVANTYVVTFLDKDGAVLKMESVNKGKSATAPTPPSVKGYKFVKWDTDFTAITKNLTVKAIYEKEAVVAPETGNTGSDDTNKDKPKTGDSTTTSLFFAFALLGLVTMSIIVVNKKRKE